MDLSVFYNLLIYLILIANLPAHMTYIKYLFIIT